MVERQIAVAEVIVVLPDFNPIAASVFKHPRQPRFCIRLPRVEHIHVVLTAAYLTQILNTVIVFVAVNVVYLLFRKTAFANSPNGMMQTNMNHPLAHTAINA